MTVDELRAAKDTAASELEAATDDRTSEPLESVLVTMAMEYRSSGDEMGSRADSYLTPEERQSLVLATADYRTAASIAASIDDVLDAVRTWSFPRDRWILIF